MSASLRLFQNEQNNMTAKRYDLNISEQWHALKVKVSRKNQYLTISMLAKLSENICDSILSDFDFAFLLLGGVCEENV